jgi:hypothetical protein
LDWCRSTLTQFKDGWHPDLPGKSPINWLVGHRLPKKFEKRLKGRASTTPDGPCHRFAKAFMTEFNVSKRNGKSYASSTIVDALKFIGKGRNLPALPKRLAVWMLTAAVDDAPAPPF